MAKKKKVRYLSTGSTMLNLAISGKYDGGFPLGHYTFFVGDSQSGKTFLVITCLAEAANNPAFDDYRLIYDGVEEGAMMDVAKFFGKKTAVRLEAPNTDGASYSIEDFYFNVDDAIKDGRKFIYILDSMDALSSSSAEEKFEERKTAHRKGKETAGSYGDGKAKYNSEHLRKLIRPLKDSGSILIIINQTRDNLGFGFEKKTRSGGKALRFYAAVEIWSAVKGIIKKKVKEKDRPIGMISECRVKKNRVSGKDRNVLIPIFNSHGVDDIQSCINYLLEEKHWKKTNGIINAPEFEFKGKEPKLIHHIEENNYELDLRSLVQDVWDEIEASLVTERKPRYE